MSNIITVSWTELKAFIENRPLPLQYLEQENSYIISAVDGALITQAVIPITDPASADQSDFEDNYKSNSNKPLSSVDSETGGLRFTPKFAPTGWKQQRFETEFQTSTADSVHEKDYLNQDIGWSSLKFYKTVNGEDVECIDQADRDLNCTRTDLEWMPNMDYMIKGGWVSQFQDLDEDLYAWVQAGVLDPQYGVSPVTFAEGGINLRYIAQKTPTGLDGVAGTILSYSHPLLGPGLGTNKIRFVLRHSAGKKQRIQCIMDIFRAYD